jgi:hypothetical protein
MVEHTFLPLEAAHWLVALLVGIEPSREEPDAFLGFIEDA